ncbi:uncharacterized protein K452DRAFT_315994 [Aplosporella prunicola CBS 121167]|uniref:AA1-like domain-containing protein n=1 Tax=Aplosporella prunicola CBS 121167 TaxID=1176127 RepID=A0A6A6BNX7_9PEZI|nr:uncharacterized protein K452DRAFT_315994 [Aplosporella prunicola CBS 121167]KAF2145849.1 hypothetical protein K452DRAFT_315994 [Aplosporella prunicola CBS 121167]
MRRYRCRAAAVFRYIKPGDQSKNPRTTTPDKPTASITQTLPSRTVYATPTMHAPTLLLSTLALFTTNVAAAAQGVASLSSIETHAPASNEDFERSVSFNVKDTDSADPVTAFCGASWDVREQEFPTEYTHCNATSWAWYVTSWGDGFGLELRHTYIDREARKFHERFGSPQVMGLQSCSEATSRTGDCVYSPLSVPFYREITGPTS